MFMLCTVLPSFMGVLLHRTSWTGKQKPENKTAWTLFSKPNNEFGGVGKQFGGLKGIIIISKAKMHEREDGYGARKKCLYLIIAKIVIVKISRAAKIFLFDVNT